MLLSIYIWTVSCEKDENKQKEAGIDTDDSGIDNITCDKNMAK